jgi:Na+-driven multidrug efflux pump
MPTSDAFSAVAIGRALLVLMRLVVFGLSLGLTLISFQSYRRRESERLQYAFVGFAFISMGVAVSTILAQLALDTLPELTRLFFRGAETLPFIVGFASLYISLYR